MTEQAADAKNPHALSAAQLFDLQQQVAVVTGGANGIGLMAVETLARAGARVVLTDVDAEVAERAAAALCDQGLEVSARSLEVTDEAAVQALFTGLSNDYGRLDVLINSAGTAKRSATVDTTLDDWNRVINVNLTGLFLCCREAARLMLAQRRGSVINMSSIMGHSGGGIYPNPAYHASKGAVVNLTRALAAEWGEHGVRVNDIAPTWVNTRMPAQVLNDPALRPRMDATMPLGRIAEVGDLAGAVLFLASPAAAMVTGHSLAVDGGYLCC